MISFENLSLSYGKKHILTDADIRAEDGEVTVILGLNGSGKTSLINAVFSTRVGTSSGKVYVNGRDTRELGRRELARLVALMPQSLPSPDVSVRELVSFGRSPYLGAFARLGRAECEKVDSAMELMEISHLAERSASGLSGGEKQAAYFAMILAKDAPCVLLDEPASALDLENKKKLFSFVNALKKQGRCIILVMHDLTDAVSIADRIYVIHDGEASRPMTPSEFATSDFPLRVFGARAHTVMTELGERQVFLAI